MKLPLLRRVRPLQLRPGSRYRCFGDGVCCSDLHAVGPLSLSERSLLRSIADGVVTKSPNDDHVLAMRADGKCVFLSEEGCALHEPLGGRLKPRACRQFPLGITETPSSWRVTLESRCSCATLGDRPELTEAEVRAALTDRRGRLVPDFTVTELRARPGETMAFDAYEALERDWLAQLATGADPAGLLDVAPLEGRPPAHWERLGRSYLADPGTTRFHDALRWLGAALARLAGADAHFPEARPWTDGFDRAEARTPVADDPGAIERAWLAESWWSLKWARRGSLAVARRELATRLAAVRVVREELEARGARPDRAAAEAVMIADLIGDAPSWDEVVVALDV